MVFSLVFEVKSRRILSEPTFRFRILEDVAIEVKFVRVDSHTGYLDCVLDSSIIDVFGDVQTLIDRLQASDLMSNDLRVVSTRIIGDILDSSVLSEDMTPVADTRQVGRLLTWTVGLTAKVVPATYSARYSADLLSELTETSGRLARLQCAARQALRTPAASAAFRSAARQIGEES
jgi:hypothetical protein